jgi:adenosyl cobinamide kinase/adenosyl cobinamide phosphate guanylyltransferase
MNKIIIHKDKNGQVHFVSEFCSYETIGLLETMREMVLLQMAQEWKKKEFQKTEIAPPKLTSELADGTAAAQEQCQHTMVFVSEGCGIAFYKCSKCGKTVNDY